MISVILKKPCIVTIEIKNNTNLNQSSDLSWCQGTLPCSFGLKTAGTGSSSPWDPESRGSGNRKLMDGWINPICFQVLDRYVSIQIG